ncbi:hypothetical protein T484DRAFT_1847749, partial [Baffinella frigidus]
EEDVEEKSELTKLNRKMRLEANRLRPVSEEYPDEDAEKQQKQLVRKAIVEILNLQALTAVADAEKQRKRLVRKAVVEILNLQAVKDWKTEQKTIQEVETKKLQTEQKTIQEVETKKLQKTIQEVETKKLQKTIQEVETKKLQV